MPRRDLGQPLRIVVKIGSAVIAPGGTLDTPSIARLANDLCSVLDADADRRAVIVSSGAVASGFRSLGLARPPRDIVHKQAAAAVGQPRLMSAWAEAFAGCSSRPVAQVLLTAEDIDHRTRVLNARRTLEALLDSGVTPIVNENDSVSFAEIKLGDNDHLSSLVASLVGADLLVILSSVAGVWAADQPVKAKGTPVIVPEIRSLADGLRHVRSDTSSVGTGGMATKVKACCLAQSLGIGAVIADGGAETVLSRLFSGAEIGTYFPPNRAPSRNAAARKKWIGFSARPRGTLSVDSGAHKAITQRGASLLPSGLAQVVGEFPRGALVELAGPDRVVFARGLTSYSASELRQIRGRKTADIAQILGYCYADEVIHRDDLTLTETSATATSTTPKRPRR